MSTHNALSVNTLQAGLRQSTKEAYQSAIQEWTVGKFDENDLFVTLTYPDYAAPDETQRTADVRVFLRKLNRKIFGRAFDKGHTRLKCFPIFELNKAGSLHVHMLIGRPNDISHLNVTLDVLIKDIWVKMKCGGKFKGQDVRDCTDVMGLMSYLTKQIKSADKLLNVDWLNINWQ